ncbi:MAG: hypothetical protein QG608_2330, partial [Actinomycetota bacterium]|nr:hypothetical protein [Actinomycetota bacterium]
MVGVFWGKDWAVGKVRAAALWGAAARGGVSGGVLLSHPVPRAVPSALAGLASGFGMGPGV